MEFSTSNDRIYFGYAKRFETIVRNERR